MKKGMKKLSLHRETLRSLAQRNLKTVAGGSAIEDPVIGDSHFDHTCGSVCDIPSWHCTRCSIC